jgi:uncharacterized membrane protein YeiB
MTNHGQSCADRDETRSAAFRARRHTKRVVAGVVRTFNLTVADALYAYALTGSAFATLMVIAAPHLDVLLLAPSTAKDEPAGSVGLWD